MGKSKTNAQLDKHDDKLHDVKYETLFGNLDQSSTSDGAGPGNEVNWGSGNTAENYNIAVNQIFDVELGLKVHYRQGADILPTSYDAATGTASYEVPEGLQPGSTNRATWNFDFSVNTGIDGSKKTLDDFDFRIVMTSGDGEVGKFNLAHLAPGNTPWVNSANPTTGFADEDGSNAQLSQNSVNLGFDFMQAIFGADFNNAGEHYTVELQAFKGLQLIGVVTSQIDVLATGGGGGGGTEIYL